MDNINEQINQRIRELENCSERLKNLIKAAELEKDLLNIASYEYATFCTNGKSIKQLNNIKLDRLTLVYPPSFVFSVKLQVSGYFNVKYKSAKSSLPVQIDPFTVGYSGIAIQHENELEVKNESIKILKDLIN